MEPTNQITINSLFIDKRLADYQEQKELHAFWDLFAMTISLERIKQELVQKEHTYYGNEVEARNALIKKDLEEKSLFSLARHKYAKMTCDKILHFFRSMVFSWSDGGKNYAKGDGTISRYQELPITYLEHLYSTENIGDMEEISEIIDEVIIKIEEEFELFEAVRACADFYQHRPSIGKNIAIYRNCLRYITRLLFFVHRSKNDAYFQSACAHIKQYRDMLDPIKEAPEDFKIFLSMGDKSTSQIRQDIEKTLLQHVETLILFSQMQGKASKEDLKNDLDGFLKETGYSLDQMGHDVFPLYKSTLDRLMFKKSGWELKNITNKT